MHPWAEVDLDAIVHNLTAVAALVRPAKVLAVVKADAYGHGAVAVAGAVEAAGAAMLGTATVAEGLLLRRARIQAPLLVLGPAHGEEAAAASAGLTITVFDDAGLQGAAEAGREGTPVRVHLKFDTGMTRLGFPPERAAEVVERAAALGLLVEGVFTHLAAAEDDPEFTRHQLDRFAPVAQAVRARFPDAIRHAAATAALLAHPESRLDLVRLGLGLYGLLPAPPLASGIALRPAMTLWGKVAQVRRITPGETVGYGRTFRAAAVEWIATVTIGYGDGYPRLLSGKGHLLAGGRRVPVVGRVSMEYVTVNLGSGTTSPVQPGDSILVFGPGLPIEELADSASTISYEILTSIAPRVRRIYRRGDRIIGMRDLLTTEGIPAPHPAAEIQRT
jgi:alanine racemase